MEELRKQKRAQVIKVLLAVLAVFAFVLVCTDIGKTRPTTVNMQTIRSASAASSGEGATVVAERESDSLLFINSSGQLVGIFGLDDREAPINEAMGIHQSGNNVYVLGVKRAEDGEKIQTEAILKFDIAGGYLGTVWKQDFEASDIQVNPSVTDFTTDGDGNLILVRFNEQEMHSLDFDGNVTKVMLDGTEEQVLRESVYPENSISFEIHYDPQNDRCVVTDLLGELFVEQDGSGKAVLASTGDRRLAVQTLDVRDGRAVMYDETSHSLLRVDNLFGDMQFTELGTATWCDNLSINGDTATAIVDAGTVRIYDMTTGASHDLTEAPLAPAFCARMVALYASEVYLTILLVAFAIWWMVRTVTGGEYAKIRRAIVATAVGLICLFGMGFSAVGLFGITLSARQASMAQIVSQASVTSPAELGDAATNSAYRAMGTMPDDDGTDLMAVVYNVEGILASSFANSTGVQCSIYVLGDDGEVRYLFSNQRDSIALGEARGEEMASAVRNAINGANEHINTSYGHVKAYQFAHYGQVQIASYLDRGGREIVACVAPLIARDGTCITAIAVSCHLESLMESLLDNLWGYLLTFTMVAASVYIVFDELTRSGAAFLRYRELLADGKEWAENLLGRPVCFMLSLAFGMDSAFAVVIAKEMLAGGNLDSTAFVWGIPAFAIAMGTTVGSLVHVMLCTRMPARSYAVGMISLGIAAQILCFFAVVNKWFIVFVICKFITSASFATTSFVGKNLAGGTAGKDVGGAHMSLTVNRSAVGFASKGAAVVASVIGGALTAAGNEWVYLAEALVCLLTIPLVLLALPQGRIISKHGDQANLRNVFGFLTSPVMLATLVFAIFPTVLASGYKSYILPLFLDSAGVSKTDIASLFALGNVILYAFTDSLIPRRNRIGRWLLTCVGLVGLGVLFVLFSFNQSPTWAVVAVVVITLLSWLAGDWKHTGRFWAKKDYGFSYDQSQATLDIEGSIVKDAQAPALAGLLTFGTSACCLILGVILMISGGGYYLFTRQRRDQV